VLRACSSAACTSRRRTKHPARRASCSRQAVRSRQSQSVLLAMAVPAEISLGLPFPPRAEPNALAGGVAVHGRLPGQGTWRLELRCVVTSTTSYCPSRDRYLTGECYQEDSSPKFASGCDVVVRHRRCGPLVSSRLRPFRICLGERHCHAPSGRTVPTSSTSPFTHTKSCDALYAYLIGEFEFERPGLPPTPELLLGLHTDSSCSGPGFRKSDPTSPAALTMFGTTVFSDPCAGGDRGYLAVPTGLRTAIPCWPADRIASRGSVPADHRQS
jgi:hypothetical protein